MSHICLLALVFTTFLSSLPMANAATSIEVTTQGLPNEFGTDVPIKASSAAIPLMKLKVTAASAPETLTSVQVNFSTTSTNFATGDLAAIATGATSGVALYADNTGAGTAGVFDANDNVVTLAASPDWTPSTTNIVLTAASATALADSGITTFFVVVKTSGTISANDKLTASIPVSGIVTSLGNGPATAYTANSYKADTTAPAISTVTGFAASATINVKFSEPVRQFHADVLTAAASLVTGDFAFVDGGTTGGSTFSSIVNNPGQDFATITQNNNLDPEDFVSTISTLAAGTNKIMDLAGNVMGTSAVNFTSPLTITTNVLPASSAAANYGAISPAPTLAASGGTTPYTFAPNAAADTTILTNIGLTLNSNGTITGTVTAGVSGSFNFLAKVTDSTGSPVTVTKPFTINISSSAGGAVPGISTLSPPGLPTSSTAQTVTITGTNTSFANGATVEFTLPPGVGGTNGVTVGSTTVASATSLTVPVTVAANATVGSRDIKVTSGNQVVNMPGGFNVLLAGATGLQHLSPANASSNQPIPPSFSINKSTNASLSSYRVIVKSGSDFSTATTMWDYAFPKQADANNSNGSHCTGSGISCDIGYGAGAFTMLTQPKPLSPNTTYYWQVKTYSQAYTTLTSANIGTTEPLESTSIGNFTTIASITDTMAPGIMHRGVTSTTESANLDMFARVMDNVATKDTTPALTTSIFYCAGGGCTPANETAGTYVGNGYYKFRIPSATVSTAGTVLRYYLKASDGTNTTNFKKPDATPFQLTAAAAGAVTIAGTVKDSDDACPAGVQGATVFAEGTGISATTNGSCVYTLSALTAGAYDIVAVKEGYSDRFMMGIPTGSSSIAFKLASGATGGFGGDTSKPKVNFMTPMDGSTNMPTSGTMIIVGFSKEMSQNSVTKAGNLVVKEVNNSTGTATDITTSKGSWTYYPTSPGGAMPPVNKIAVWTFTGSNTFTEGKSIAVVVSPDVTDTSGNSVQGNQPDGSFAFSFSTGVSVAAGATFGVGYNVPPHVQGTFPAPGAVSIPTNARPSITFSQAMETTLTTNVKLFTVTNGVETDVSATAIDSVLSQGTNKTQADFTIKSTYNGGFLSANTTYRIKVLGGAKSATNITLAPVGQGSNVMWTSDFKTSSGTDTTAPTVIGVFPEDAATSVAVNTGAITISFSQSMIGSTIDTNSITLTAGSSTITGTVEYRANERQAYFIPSAALSPSTIYTLTLATTIKGFNNQALASAVTKSFTTSSTADSTAPTISFVNADDYNLAITFSEPMVAAKAIDSLNFPASVLKSGNYSIKYGDSGFASGAGTLLDIPATAVMEYDGATNTVLIKGYNALSAANIQGKEILVSITNVKDRSGNAITVGTGTNTGRAPVKNSLTTGGAITPGATGTSSFTGGMAVPTNFSSSTFGFAPPVEVRPFNMMAGTTTIYGVRLPISKQIPASGMILITFPVGFDVSGAKQDTNSPMRSDLNGPGTGTPTFKCNGSTPISCGGAATVTGDSSGGGDSATRGGVADDGVTVNTSSRTVTVHLSAATSSTNDFLNIDIGGIKNSTSPKDFNTDGYKADVKTKSSETILESLTSNPFYLQSAGAYTLSGTITATGNNQSGTMKVYLMSPLTGPVEATSADFGGGATAAYSIGSLPAGDYMLFTDQEVTIGNATFQGRTTPERIFLTGNTTFNFTMASNTTGSAVTVAIDGPASEPVDIFAGSPNGFKVKQVTLDNTTTGGGKSENVTLNLPNGKWFVGVGPQMPKGPMSGPPKVPTYIMPKPLDIEVSAGPAFKESSGTADDGTLVFVLTSSDKTIKGLVQDPSGKVMANAEVFAYSATGGFGTRATTDTGGAFTLNVVDGSYIIGSFVPGMPPAKELSVIVNSNALKGGHATNYIFIDGSRTGVSPSTAASNFVLKVAKPDYTIAGKVTDGTNVVQGASVNAYRTDGPGNANVLTSSDGTYTLYVTSGTWKVSAFMPQYGRLSEQTVTITTESSSNVNFAPSSTGTFNSVSGRVYKDTNGNSSYDSGEQLANAFVKIKGNSTSNETITATDGTYSFKVPQCSTGTCYVVSAFAPDVGDLPPTAAFTVTGNVTDKDIRVGALKAVTITLSSSVTQAFVELVSTNSRAGGQIEGTTTKTLSVPDGTYRVNVFLPGTVLAPSNMAATDGNTTFNTTTGVVTVNGAEGITVTLPTQRTVTGTVTNGASNIPDAWVEIVNTSGVHVGTKTDTNGAFSIKIQDGTYKINAMKPGYFSDPTSLVVSASTAAQTLTLSTASLSISGTVRVGGVATANAFVRAEKQGGGFAGTQADASGEYTLYVGAGTWKVYAVAEGYAENSYSSALVVTTESLTGKNITLSTPVTLDRPTSKPITPSSGGTVEDATLGVALVLPANALGTSSSAGNVEISETNNVRKTSTATPMVGGGREVTVTDSEGSPVTTLNDSAEFEIEMTKAELDDTNAADGTACDTEAEVNRIQLGYWDETTGNWVTVPTTITYRDSSDAVVPDPASNLSDVASVEITGTTDHFSLYAPLISTDASAPTTPSGLAATVASTTGINLSWTLTSGATSYDIYRSTSSDGTFSRIGSEPTVSSGSTTTYADTGLSSGTAYYYKISSLNSSGESAASSAVTATTTAAASGGSTPSTGGGSATSNGGGGGSSDKAKDVKTETTDTEEDKTTDSKEEKVETKAEAKAFKDITNHWAAAFIEKLASKGIVNGYDSEHYGPDNKITRAEFTKVVIEMFDIELPASVTESSFKDVKTTDWYSAYVEAALTNDLVDGYSDKTFRPNQPINRAEAMKIILTASGMDLATDFVATFPDLDKKGWYIAYVNYAAENGIVSGYKDGTFGPGKNLTRAEVAKIASLMLDMTAETEEEDATVGSSDPTELIKSVLKF